MTTTRTGERTYENKGKKAKALMTEEQAEALAPKGDDIALLKTRTFEGLLDQVWGKRSYARIVTTLVGKDCAPIIRHFASRTDDLTLIGDMGAIMTELQIDDAEQVPGRVSTVAHFDRVELAAFLNMVDKGHIVAAAVARVPLIIVRAGSFFPMKAAREAGLGAYYRYNFQPKGSSDCITFFVAPNHNLYGKIWQPNWTRLVNVV